MERIWRAISLNAKGIVLLFVGCGISMFIGYTVFSHLARPLLTPPAQEERLIEEGRALRQHANALVRLLSDFLNASRGDPARFEVWLDEVFRPSVARTQRAVRTQRHDGPAQAELIAAVNHLAALAERPYEDERRAQTVSRVLDAAAAAEERIGELGVAPFMEEPAQLLQFRLYGQ